MTDRKYSRILYHFPIISYQKLQHYILPITCFQKNTVLKNNCFPIKTILNENRLNFKVEIQPIRITNIFYNFISEQVDCWMTILPNRPSFDRCF